MLSIDDDRENMDCSWNTRRLPSKRITVSALILLGGVLFLGHDRKYTRKEQEFPKGFVWGAATSSYQIEGATTEDGRGVSIWDTYCNEKGTISDRSSGTVACDHYHRFKHDVKMMKSLGLKAYRFSIAWPRIFPNGTGTVNKKGVEFYNQLIDVLLENGIEPWYEKVVMCLLDCV